MVLLHISDPHAQTEVNRRLDALVGERNQDVIAVTGDCISRGDLHVPCSWNDWPADLKLCVPGNHDKEDSYSSLSTWIHGTPWSVKFRDTLFLGLDTSETCTLAHAQIPRAQAGNDGVAAVVLLSHRWPVGADAEDIGKRVLETFGAVSLLFLHGHDHRDFVGSLWEPDARLGAVCGFRKF